MRLRELLTLQDEDTLGRLTADHLTAGESHTRAEACVNLDAALRAPKHVRTTLYNRRPPCFWILQQALDAGGTLSLSSLREDALAGTERIADAVSAGALVGRAQGADLYRRVLMEAWRSDFEIDSSEIRLLGVLRTELGLRDVDHFLIEHHAEVQVYWNTDHAFLDVLHGLRSSGVAYVVDGNLVLPRDTLPIIGQVIGIELGTSARRRLFELLSGASLGAALSAHELKATGSKAERVQRLLDGYAQPSHVLDVLTLSELRDLCSALELKTSGNKEVLIDRVAECFASGDDQHQESSDDQESVSAEPRILPNERFQALLLTLSGRDLSDILLSIGSRRVTGSKEHLASLIIESPYSEESLLRKLEVKQLEPSLRKLGLKTAGSKGDKIHQFIRAFA
jgi:hypothetical protein